MSEDDVILARKILACRLCAERFAATDTHHEPRPVPWFRGSARLVIAGQAPGLRVHEAGRPFADRSGDRLRDWMEVGEATFYDRDRIAVVPMAFCFPGYDAKGSDLPPPAICARSWQARVLAVLPRVELILTVGAAAQRWHLGERRKVSEVVADWRAILGRNSPGPRILPLPHPSWRNTAWLKRHPWFEAELLPVLRAEVARILELP
ncbi:uracil-DNA glycosylase [Defluviimonas sp. 20V17]|uniref:Uracil-DNA glycosylase n=1 Tax=Allgaiera indica TaxID=765699 RepID=A0AAN4UTN1_9RHOB|nr:uracil-DNA glycosylase family protein [Allgaiera indica]KDB05423.1 uracil-DNA glycosylase [Defluviimonas sp. 20V17]GHE04165.1 uracil-DNA glycosylase [Allgaiera indica]SDX50177.1 Uracil-DNA glycosylase [Allgaiera indica]